ncbi:MAG: hypothetical protein RL748_1123 [Pseudomonadota bacterium]|jgi:hypothetical protein
MDQRLLDFLTQAPSYELFEICCAIGRILDDPARISEIRKRLQAGMRVQYLDKKRLTPAVVVALYPAKVHIQDLSTNKHWQVHYAAILIDESTPAMPQAALVPKSQVDKNSFQVGDTVAFTDKYLHQRIGKVVRRNEKSVTVDCEGATWRVGWGLLSKVIDV